MYDKLPSDLKQNALFCLWKYEERNGKLTKVPYQVNSAHADSANKRTFTGFGSVVNASSAYDGIGIGVFGEYSAIDIDHCVAGGKLAGLAQDIVDIMNSYTQYSPSGTGIRVLIKTSGLAYDKKRYYINNRKLGLELYVAGMTNKFVTITGKAIRENSVEERSAELLAVLEKYMVKPQKEQGAKSNILGSYLSDESVITKVLASKQGEKFKALWDGKIPDGKSHSEADQALCAILAF